MIFAIATHKALISLQKGHTLAANIVMSQVNTAAGSVQPVSLMNTCLMSLRASHVLLASGLLMTSHPVMTFLRTISCGKMSGLLVPLQLPV